IIESRTDQPRTRPVALRRNSVGVSPPTVPAAMLASQVMIYQDQIVARSCPEITEVRLCLAIHEKVFADLALLRVQVQHRTLQHSVAVDAAGVDGERPAHLLDPAAL